MSLILNNEKYSSCNLPNGPGDNFNDAALLDRYLALIQINKAAARFVPNDALLALDMAGFVRDRLMETRKHAQISAARMALTLVQPEVAPIQ